MKVDLGAIFEAVAQGDAGVDSEVGLGGEFDSEEMSYGGGEGAAVEDLGVAEDVHQEGVGAVGTVELHPWPVGAGARTAVGGVDFGKAALPVGGGADGGVAGRVEVAVAGLIVGAEDDAGLAARGLFVQETAGGGETIAFPAAWPTR